MIRKGIILGILFSVVLVPFSIAGDGRGIGFRFGDPSGITFKKYMGDRALEINFGRSYLWNGQGYYNNSFNNYYKNKKYNYYSYSYVGYSRTFPLSLQLHYLFQKPLPVKGESKGGRLDWYYGAGAQIRWQSITYGYWYRETSNSALFYDEDVYFDLDLGIDGVLGIEYIFSSAPITLFLDGNVFLEIVDHPFYFWWQSGLGIRYNF